MVATNSSAVSSSGQNVTIGQTDVGTQVIDGFAFAVTGRALNLSALIVLLMLRDLAVVTNAIVRLNLTQHKIEAGADVRTVLTQGGRTHVHPTLMRGRVGTWPSGSNRWPGRR